MSTKVSIAARIATPSAPGFHLYWDCVDELVAASEDEVPVYLHLAGVAVELQTMENGGASVTVKLPRELARELGLLRSPA